MDFKQIEVYPGMDLSRLFEEVHNDKKSRASQINRLIEQLQAFLTNIGDAVQLSDKITALIAEGVKNQDILVKLLAIVAKAAAQKPKDDKDTVTLPQEEIDELIRSYNVILPDSDPVKLINRNNA